MRIAFISLPVAGHLNPMATHDRLPGILKESGVDGVVLDTYQFYIELAPMNLGMPYVHVSNALHFDYTGRTPLCVYDWPYETDAEALARNRTERIRL